MAGSYMQGRMVPVCAWAIFVPETVVVSSEPQYVLLCTVDDSLLLTTLHLQSPYPV